MRKLDINLNVFPTVSLYHRLDSHMKSATLRPHQLSLREAIARMTDGRLTCEALVLDCLDRINERDPQVQAWSHLDPELAIRTARPLDRVPRRGVLHRISIRM